jgi:hypothetical protein
MARLTAAARRALPASDFAGPHRSYPIPDKAHAIAAKGRAKEFASPSLKSKVDAKANKRLDHAPPGFGSMTHRNKPINAPSSFAGRRDASHAKAYR